MSTQTNHSLDPRKALELVREGLARHPEQMMQELLQIRERQILDGLADHKVE